MFFWYILNHKQYNHWNRYVLNLSKRMTIASFSFHLGFIRSGRIHWTNSSKRQCLSASKRGSSVGCITQRSNNDGSSGSARHVGCIATRFVIFVAQRCITHPSSILLSFCLPLFPPSLFLSFALFTDIDFLLFVTILAKYIEKK